MEGPARGACSSPSGLFADMLGDATEGFLPDGISDLSHSYQTKNGLKTKGQWTREEDAHLTRCVTHDTDSVPPRLSVHLFFVFIFVIFGLLFPATASLPLLFI